MIYVYNEASVPIWEMVEKNETFIRIGVGGSRIGVDIMKRNVDIDTYDKDILENTAKEKGRNTLKVVSCNSYGCYFHNKTGNPFLHTVEKASEYSLDVFLLSYELPEGMRVCKEKSTMFTILYTNYDKALNVINIIAVAKPVNKPKFYLTFTNEDQTVYDTRHLVTNELGVVNVISRSYTKAELNKSKYKASIIGKPFESNELKPSKITHPYGIIVCPKDIREKYCEGKFHMSTSHTIYYDPEDPELYNKLRKLQSEHYAALTLYIDKPMAEVKEEDATSKYRSMFKKVNFICADGKMYS